MNARIDELQAALLRTLLPRLDAANDRREEIADAYGRTLAGVGELGLPAAIEGTRPAWHLYVVEHPRRDELAGELARAGIGTGVHYPVPLSSQPSCRRTALSLPMHPGLTDAQVERVTAAVRDACSRV